MIILNKTSNTQVIYIGKRKNVGVKAASGYYTKQEADARFQPKGDYATMEDLEKIDIKYTPGANINITDKVISWVAPDLQFVNTIFTDDEVLKYAIADFEGGYIEKEFPIASNESAGLMSATEYNLLYNLQSQIGNIATALDLINGEVI